MKKDTQIKKNCDAIRKGCIIRMVRNYFKQISQFIVGQMVVNETFF